MYFILEFSFWKSNARKVFAVSKSCFEASQSDNRRPNPYLEVMSTLNQLETNIENTIQQNMILPRTSSLEEAIWSTQLIGPLKDCFKCLICRGTSVSPVVFSLCCKQILGCKSCNDEYNRTLCPHCREEDYEKVEVVLFENLLQIMQQNNI